MTPRSQATALRVWQLCDPMGWDLTIAEVAAELGKPKSYISSVCRQKGWMGRLRASKVEHASHEPLSHLATDLEHLATINVQG